MCKKGTVYVTCAPIIENYRSPPPLLSLSAMHKLAHTHATRTHRVLALRRCCIFMGVATTQAQQHNCFSRAPLLRGARLVCLLRGAWCLVLDL